MRTCTGEGSPFHPFSTVCPRWVNAAPSRGPPHISSVGSRGLVSVPEPAVSDSGLAPGHLSGRWGDFPRWSVTTGAELSLPPAGTPGGGKPVSSGPHKGHVQVRLSPCPHMSEVQTFQLSYDDGARAVELARESVLSYVRHGQREQPGSMRDSFYNRTGALVRIKSTRGMGRLRGCAGAYRSTEQLGHAIVDAAIEAASRARVGRRSRCPSWRASASPCASSSTTSR
jgi:Uncharacterized conserved protein